MVGQVTAGGRVKLPRDSTRQAEGPLYGLLNKTFNRWSGIAILVFLVAHLVGVASLRLDGLSALRDAAPWFVTLHYRTWVRAVLFAAISFHFLHGLKLVLLDLGMRVSYRLAFWMIVAVSVSVFLMEMSTYVGI